MANQVEILLKATDEASAVLKTFGDNADTALQGTTASAANTASGMEGLASAAGIAIGAVTAVVGAVVALSAAYATSLSSLLDYVEGLEKANQSTGVSVEFWQKLIKTGEEMDVSFDQIRGSVERMEKALEGNGEALRKFGIEVATFEGLNADEKLRAMAVQIMAIEDPALRAAAAMAATGRSGAEMVPIFAAIVSGAVDAQKVLGPEMTAYLGQTDQALDKAKTAWKELTHELIGTIAMKADLAGWFDLFKLGLQHLGDFAHAAKLAATGHAYLAGEMLVAARAADQQTTSVRGTSQATLDLVETERQLRVKLDELVKIWEAEEKQTVKNEAARKKLNAELERGRKWAVEQISKETAETRKQMEAEAKRIDEAIKGEEKLSQKMATEEAKQLRAQQEKFKKMAEAAEHYFERVIAGVSRSSDTEVQQAARVLTDAIARRAELLANHEATNAQILKSDEAVAAARKALADAELREKLGHFDLIASGASSMLKSLFGKSKTAAIAAAIIDTIAAIVKTMAAYPWPWSLVPAAAAAVAGYAQVAKIRSQDIGFAQGTPGTSFVDFGRGSVEMLHGQEAVVTRPQAESVASLVRDAIEEGARAARAVSSAPARDRGEGEPAVILDGEVLGRWITRRNRAGLLPVAVR